MSVFYTNSEYLMYSVHSVTFAEGSSNGYSLQFSIHFLSTSTNSYASSSSNFISVPNPVFRSIFFILFWRHRLFLQIFDWGLSCGSSQINAILLCSVSIKSNDVYQNYYKLTTFSCNLNINISNFYNCTN